MIVLLYISLYLLLILFWIFWIISSVNGDKCKGQTETRFCQTEKSCCPLDFFSSCPSRLQRREDFITEMDLQEAKYGIWKICEYFLLKWRMQTVILKDQVSIFCSCEIFYCYCGFGCLWMKLNVNVRVQYELKEHISSHRFLDFVAIRHSDQRCCSAFTSSHHCPGKIRL